MTGGKRKKKENRMHYTDRKRWLDAVASGRVVPKFEDPKRKSKV